MHSAGWEKACNGQLWAGLMNGTFSIAGLSPLLVPSYAELLDLSASRSFLGMAKDQLLLAFDMGSVVYLL